MGCYGLPLIVMIFCYAKIFFNLASRAKTNSLTQRSESPTTIKLYELTHKNEFGSLRVTAENDRIKTENIDLLSKTESSRLRSNSNMETNRKSIFVLLN